MSKNIVKELNEIKDVYDGGVKDGANVVDALDGIREAIEQDGEWTTSKDVADAVSGVKGALESILPVFRNFSYTTIDADESGAMAGKFLPVYDASNVLVIYDDPTSDASEGKNGKLPVINGECKINFTWTGCAVALDETSTGCSLTGELDNWVLSINEDNANAILNVTSGI